MTKKKKSPLLYQKPILIFIVLLAFLAGGFLGFKFKDLYSLQKRGVFEAGETEKSFFIIDPEKRIKSEVWYVIDGDTIALSKHEHVRLLGIEADKVSTDQGTDAQIFLQKLWLLHQE